MQAASTNTIPSDHPLIFPYHPNDDTLNLHFFILNGNEHTVWVEDPNGTVVTDVTEMNRGREYDFSVSAVEPGVYRLICSTHGPTMTAEILVLPRT